MGRKITAARQRNAVSQGMALGLCMLERYELKFEKLRVDLAFEHAWRDWPDSYKSQFSQVDTTPLFWDWSSGKLTIHRRGDDWDSDDPNDVEYALSMVDGDVPLEGWISLARAFAATSIIAGDGCLPPVVTPERALSQNHRGPFHHARHEPGRRVTPSPLVVRPEVVSPDWRDPWC